MSELLYNGSVCPNGIVTISATADVHRLEMKLAPANGSLQVSATQVALIEVRTQSAP